MEDLIMLRRFNLLPVFFALAFFTACSARVGYRAYDPGYRDYHVWNDAEIGYYNTWIVETHHPRAEYRRLHRPEQEQYWRWRYDHH